MRRHAIALLAVLVGFSGCGTSEGDAIDDACAIVVDCGGAVSMSECIDQIGSLPTDCLNCVAATDGCGYSSCQRVPGCRLPFELTGN